MKFLLYIYTWEFYQQIWVRISYIKTNNMIRITWKVNIPETSFGKAYQSITQSFSINIYNVCHFALKILIPLKSHKTLKSIDILHKQKLPYIPIIIIGWTKHVWDITDMICIRIRSTESKHFVKNLHRNRSIFLSSSRILHKHFLKSVFVWFRKYRRTWDTHIE